MKLNIIAVFTIMTFTLLSCTNKVYKQESLVGKVYNSSLGMNKNNCEPIEEGTDFYQNLIFLNDSIFIQEFFNCCPDEEDTIDFSVESIYKGRYKLDDTSLLLTYFQGHIEFYVRLIHDSIQDTTIEKNHLEIETNQIHQTRMTKFNCNKILYFKNNDVDFVEYLTPSKDSLNKYLSDLKRNKIFEKLDEIKQ